MKLSIRAMANEETVRGLIQAALSGDQRLTQIEEFMATGSQRFNAEVTRLEAVTAQNRETMEQVVSGARSEFGTMRDSAEQMHQNLRGLHDQCRTEFDRQQGVLTNMHKSSTDHEVTLQQVIAEVNRMQIEQITIRDAAAKVNLLEEKLRSLETSGVLSGSGSGGYGGNRPISDSKAVANVPTYSGAGYQEFLEKRTV